MSPKSKRRKIKATKYFRYSRIHESFALDKLVESERRLKSSREILAISQKLSARIRERLNKSGFK